METRLCLCQIIHKFSRYIKVSLEPKRTELTLSLSVRIHVKGLNWPMATVVHLISLYVDRSVVCCEESWAYAQWPQMVSRQIFAKMLLSTLAAPMVWVHGSKGLLLCAQYLGALDNLRTYVLSTEVPLKYGPGTCTSTWEHFCSTWVQYISQTLGAVLST